MTDESSITEACKAMDELAQHLRRDQAYIALRELGFSIDEAFAASKAFAKEAV